MEKTLAGMMQVLGLGLVVTGVGHSVICKKNERKSSSLFLGNGNFVLLRTKERMLS